MLEQLGIIFDFDGVLVDSERTHHEAFAMLLAPLGIRLDFARDWRRYMGMDDRSGLAAMLCDAGADLPSADFEDLLTRKFALMRQWGVEGRIDPVPGAIEFARAAGLVLPTAVCSASFREDIILTLRRMGIDSCFRAVVGRDDVVRTKPDPHGYLIAAERIGRATSHCLAIEDSVPGIGAAKAAGLVAVGLSGTGALPEALQDAGADLIVSSLVNLDVRQLVNSTGLLAKVENEKLP